MYYATERRSQALTEFKNAKKKYTKLTAAEPKSGRLAYQYLLSVDYLAKIYQQQKEIEKWAAEVTSYFDVVANLHPEMNRKARFFASAIENGLELAEFYRQHDSKDELKSLLHRIDEKLGVLEKSDAKQSARFRTQRAAIETPGN